MTGIILAAVFLFAAVLGAEDRAAALRVGVEPPHMRVASNIGSRRLPSLLRPSPGPSTIFEARLNHWCSSLTRKTLLSATPAAGDEGSDNGVSWGLAGSPGDCGFREDSRVPWNDTAEMNSRHRAQRGVSGSPGRTSSITRSCSGVSSGGFRRRGSGLGLLPRRVRRLITNRAAPLGAVRARWWLRLRSRTSA